MKIMKLISILLIGATTVFTACTKEGPVGPAGANGTNGTNGSANVKSRIISISPSTWTTASSGFGYDANLSAPEITTEIASKGVVLCYLSSINSAETWLSMPYTVLVAPNTLSFDYGFSPNSFTVFMRCTVAFSKPTSPYYVRIVTIPSSGIKPNVDHMSYLAVRQAYKLDSVEAAQRQAEQTAVEEHK